MSRVLRNLFALGLTLSLVLLWSGAGEGVAAPGPDEGSPSKPVPNRRIIPTAQKTVKKKGRAKKGMPKKDDAADTSEKPAEKEKTEPAKPAAGDDAALKFSRDIAPILVGNCIGCHNARQKRGKFDMTSFEKLMKGADKEVVIVPSKPDESHLVLRIKGEETPKMPQGANRNLSDAAVEKIEQWVKAGARLDAGIDPKAAMETYAATPEQLRKAELAKMSPEERDKVVEKAGIERFKKANSKITPEVTVGKNFILLSNLPKDRATAALKVMDQKYAQLAALLSKPGAKALDWAEKASLYVFNDTNSFVEFARNVENREVEPGTVGSANFGVPQPYVAVIDPLNGKEEPPAAATPKRTARSKKSEDDEAPAATRSLAGVLTENFASGVLSNAGKPPLWVTLGVGAYLASTTDPRAAYVSKLKRDAYTQWEINWTSKANEALGGDTKAEDIRAVGFAVNDCLASTAKPYYPAFIQGMLGGQEKLDAVIENVLNGTRAQFFEMTGQWVGTRYGRGR